MLGETPTRHRVVEFCQHDATLSDPGQYHGPDWRASCSVATRTLSHRDGRPQFYARVCVGSERFGHDVARLKSSLNARLGFVVRRLFARDGDAFGYQTSAPIRLRNDCISKSPTL